MYQNSELYSSTLASNNAFFSPVDVRSFHILCDKLIILTGLMAEMGFHSIMIYTMNLTQTAPYVCKRLVIIIAINITIIIVLYIFLQRVEEESHVVYASIVMR